MSFIEANALKKGDRVQLRNGWFATMADNKKGNIRMATVEGIYTETGSVYAHDIEWYFDAVGAKFKVVQLGKAAKRAAAAQAAMKALGFSG